MKRWKWGKGEIFKKRDEGEGCSYNPLSIRVEYSREKGSFCSKI